MAEGIADNKRTRWRHHVVSDAQTKILDRRIEDTTALHTCTHFCMPAFTKNQQLGLHFPFQQDVALREHKEAHLHYLINL